jgi:peptide/nickel transport system substrate-binding protein
MRKKLWPILTIAFVVSLTLILSVSPSIAQEMDRATTAIFDIDGGRVLAPDVWNPYLPGARRDHGFHQAMMEPLFILNYETGEFVPWLGESFTPNETLDVWTLVLRDGVKWSDGEDFNADDVVFTINMLLDPANSTLNDAGSMQNWVESVEKIDDLTVQFNLKNVNPRFQLDYFSVRIWGGVNIAPEHIWNGQDPSTFTNYDPEQGWPVYTGPYLLQSISETEFVYVRDDDWWGAASGWKPLPAPEHLVWTWAGPEEARAALMADNGLDSLMDVTLGTFQALVERNPNVIAWLPQLPYATLDPCARNFEFNTTAAPWDDPEMRWAVNYAIDRNQIVEIAYEGSTVPSRSFFPAYAPLNRYTDLLEAEGVFEEYPLWTTDPDRAREIIESKGYTMGGDGYYELNGEQLSLDITTHEAFIEKQRIAAVLVEQLQAVGINASTRNEAGATWDDNYRRGNFEARMGWQNCGSVNEPWASMDTLNASWIKPVGEVSSNNGWRWDNARFSELVDQIGVLPLGDPAIDPLFVEAMSLYYSELPTIPITQARKLIPLNTTYWTNWPTAENNYTSAWTWWQSTHLVIHAIQPAG